MDTNDVPIWILKCQRRDAENAEFFVKEAKTPDVLAASLQVKSHLRVKSHSGVNPPPGGEPPG
jgi:hypothetical protein